MTLSDLSESNVINTHRVASFTTAELHVKLAIIHFDFWFLEFMHEHNILVRYYYFWL